MFIPNKTVSLVKTGGILLLCILFVIIAGQSVLYVQMSTNNKQVLMKLTAQLDSLKTTNQAFEQVSTKKQTDTEKHTVLTKTQLDSVTTRVRELESVSEMLLNNTDLLIRNECSVRPYYMEKGLLALCK